MAYQHHGRKKCKSSRSPVTRCRISRALHAVYLDVGGLQLQSQGTILDNLLKVSNDRVAGSAVAVEDGIGGEGDSLRVEADGLVPLLGSVLSVSAQLESVGVILALLQERERRYVFQD